MSVFGCRCGKKFALAGFLPIKSLGTKKPECTVWVKFFNF
jgi:hypothetical protein